MHAASTRRPTLPWLSALVAGCVAACAGAAAPAEAPARAAAGPPAAPATGTAAATATAAPAAGTCGLPRFAPDLLRRVNEFRAAPRSCGARGRFAAAAPLRWSGELALLASEHAHGMAARNQVSHDDARGRGPAERATQAGYAWRVFAENVAGNYRSTAEVMAGWQASPAHCANLMNPAVTEFGVACAPGTPRSAFETYWAMALAKPR